MFYDKESDFEDDLVAVLKRHGWTDGVLEYPNRTGPYQQLGQHPVRQQQRHRSIEWAAPYQRRDGADPRTNRNIAHTIGAEFLH